MGQKRTDAESKMFNSINRLQRLKSGGPFKYNDIIIPGPPFTNMV